MSDNILEGPEYHMELPTTSLGKLFYEHIMRYIGQPAFIDEYTGDTLTYDKVLEITCRLAQVYQNILLKTGDIIAIFSENTIYYFLPIIAAFYLGITTIPISHHYLERELRHALNMTKPAAIFCSNRTYKEIVKIRNQFPYIKYVIVTDFEKNNYAIEEVDNFTTIFYKYGNEDFMNVSLMDLDVCKSIALIMLSSGTTGLPKGVMLTHKNYISKMVHIWDPRVEFYSSEQLVLGILPFYHIAGMTAYPGAFLLGKCTRVFYKFDKRQFSNAIENYNVHTTFLVPSLAVLLAKDPIVDECDLSNLKHIIVGGAALSESTENRLVERLKIKYIRQIYGLTETTMYVTVAPCNTWKKGSSGKLVPGMMGAIRDPESGNLLGPHERGEIILKGDLIMAGYYNNPQADRGIFLENGFLRTGDLGYYDEEEHFFIIERLKDLIKYKGFQVSPAELEGLLLKHPKILDAGVIGIPDEEAGELPRAFVVKQPAAQDLSAEDVVKFVSDNISHQKRLRGGVEFIDVIPKNASGKIIRKELRRMVNNDTKAEL